MEKRIATLAVIYFITGLIFAGFFAWFYHWSALSYFSPGFYAVVLTWPIQVPGFIYDFQYFGFAGKPF